MSDGAGGKKQKDPRGEAGKQSVLGAELAVLAACALWGTSFVVVGSLVSQVSPAQVLVVRFFLATLLLGAFSLHRWPEHDPRLLRGGVTLGLWLTAGFVLLTLGQVYTSPARAAFICGFNVVVPSLIVCAANRRLPGQRVLLSTLLVCLGVGVLGFPGPGGWLNIGDLLAAASALAFGGHVYYTGRYAQYSRPDLLTVLQIAVAAACCVLIALAGYAALHIPGGSPAWASALVGQPWRWSLPILGAIIYLAAFPTVASYFLLTRSQRTISASRAGILLALEPLFATLLSVTFGYDAITAPLLIGGLMVTIGILFSTEQ